MNTLSAQACALINQLQGGFPITERPYLRVAAKFGVTEAVLIQHIRSLVDDGVLSRFGPSYDAARLGGAVTLAALSVPPAELERVTDIVNSLPAVAHNYQRTHTLNMWFVVASERPSAIAECLQQIRSRSGLEVYDFPKLREFFLGLWLEVDEQGGVRTVPPPQAPGTQSGFVLSAEVERLIRTSQGGLPLVGDPYRQLAEQCGLSVGKVLALFQQMLDAGVIRRIGAIPNHYRLGLRGNGMTVWDVPDELLPQLGERIGGVDFVSHCYERPRHPGVWPYNLFAMVHGRDRDEVRDKHMQLAEMLGPAVRGHDVLFSTAVLKKTGLRLAA